MISKEELLKRYKNAKENGKLNFLNNPIPINIKNCLMDFLVKTELTYEQGKIIHTFLNQYDVNLLVYVRNKNTNPYKPIQSLLTPNLDKQTSNPSKPAIFDFIKLLLDHDTKNEINIVNIKNFFEDIDFIKEEGEEEPKLPKKLKHIGVLDGSFLISRPRLKQYSLYFDEFVVIDIERWEKFGEKIETAYFNKKNRKELDWLIEKKIILLDSFPYGSELVQNDMYRRDFQRLQKLLELKDGILPENGARTEKEQRKIAAFLYKYSILKSRLHSIYLNTHYANIACPIIDNLDDLSLALVDMPKEHVLNVLMKNIPIPTSTTPWEQIVEFKKDPDSKDKFSRISNWLSKISTKEIKTNEIYQEIDYLLNEYEKHLNFHKMKYENSSLQTSILMDNKGYQNLKNINQKNKNKVSWTIEDINLFEAEAKMPGRELAYIVKTKEFFG